MGIYKFGNNTYPRHIRHRLNLGHIFQEKSASYGPGNMVTCILLLHLVGTINRIHKLCLYSLSYKQNC